LPNIAKITSRLLKKSIRGLFQHAKQKAATPAPPCARGIRASCTARFLLCFIFQTRSVFEKMAVLPYTATGRMPKCRERREARERPPQGDEKRVFHHPASKNGTSIFAGLLYLTVLVPACLPLLLTLQPAMAAGAAPSDNICKNGPKDAVTQGGCVVIDRAKGNCMACHDIAGTSLAGNLGPPLNYMQQRFPDKAKLRAQIWDATAINPRTIMPPFGKHGILTEEEIDKVVKFLLTL